MAEDISHDVIWLLEIEEQHLDYLGPIRHWSDLKMAASPGFYWVRGFSPGQLETPEIKAIPFKQLYYLRGNDTWLFPRGGHVPVKRLPSTLLWTSLERGLPLQLPSFNHNYFGIPEKLSIRLVPSETEREAGALLTSMVVLQDYIQTAPAMRLRPLSWVIFNDPDQALIIGQPLLPLPGGSYWLQGDFWLPAGWDLEWPVMTATLVQQLNPGGDHWLLFDVDGSCLPIARAQCRPLSISSFRLSNSIDSSSNLIL